MARIVRNLLLLWLGLIPLSGHADTAIIQFGANESSPYWSPSLAHNGMVGEILHAISKAAGLSSQIEFAPLSRLIQDESNNDLGNPAFYMAEQTYAVIIPIAVYYDALFFYRKDSDPIRTFTRLNELAGYRLGALKGTVSGRADFERYGIFLEESYSQASLFKKLKLGRIDICIEIDLVGKDVIAKLLPDETANFSSVLISGSAQPLAIMLDSEQENAKELGKRYRQGLSQIIESGEYQAIIEKYYGADHVPPSWYIELEKYDLLYSYEDSE